MPKRHEPMLDQEPIPEPGGHYEPESIIHADVREYAVGHPRTLPLVEQPSLLRRTVLSSTILGLGIGIAAGAFAGFERFAPVEIKPSTIIGAFSGNASYWQINEEQGALQARLRMVNDENLRLQQAVIDAQTTAQERIKAAESQAQQEVIAMQGNVEAMNRAYAALYERGNMFAQKSAEIVQSLANTRLQVASAQQGGKTAVANVADLVGAFGVAFGDHRLANSAYEVRNMVTQQSQAELEAAMQRGLPAIDISNWAHGLPDPATAIYSGRATTPRLSPDVRRPDPLKQVDGTKPPRSLYRQ